jgi:hypothetical protein
MNAESALLNSYVVSKIVWDILHLRYYVYWSGGLSGQSALKRKTAPKYLAVTVMNPARPFPIVDFDQAIMCETGFWYTNDFETVNIARKKAEQSWRTEKDTLVIQTQFPHLWVKDDVKWAGGIFRDGIALGVSGMHWQEDQRLGEEIASAIKEYCITESRRIMDDKNIIFV